MKRTAQKSAARLKAKDHQKLWRIVDGAVASAFNDHPDYLTEHGQQKAVESISKRVVGALVGVYAESLADHGHGHACGGSFAMSELRPVLKRARKGGGGSAPSPAGQAND